MVFFFFWGGLFVFVSFLFLVSPSEFDVTTPDSWLNLILQFQHLQDLRGAGLLGMNASHLETLTQMEDNWNSWFSNLCSLHSSSCWYVFCLSPTSSHPECVYNTANNDGACLHPCSALGAWKLNRPRRELIHSVPPSTVCWLSARSFIDLKTLKQVLKSSSFQLIYHLWVLHPLWSQQATEVVKPTLAESRARPVCVVLVLVYWFHCKSTLATFVAVKRYGMSVV